MDVSSISSDSAVMYALKKANEVQENTANSLMENIQLEEPVKNIANKLPDDYNTIGQSLDIRA